MDTRTLALIEQVKPFTKSSVERLASMVYALDHVDRRNVPGVVVECGVWRAGNIILARKLSPGRTCWLYDTFDGMPEAGEFDTKHNGQKSSMPAGKSRATRYEVIDILRTNDCWDDERIRIVEGMVEDTLLISHNIPKAISILRLDTDYYTSTKIELETLFPRLSPNGVLIVDDFGHWAGARKAVADYFRKSMPSFRPIDYTAVMMIKPG